MGVSKLFPNYFMLDVFKLEEDRYDGMISLNEKEYVLLKDGKLIKKGSGLLGRHQPSICDKFTDDLCYTLFDRKPPRAVFRKYADLSGYPVADFTMAVTFSKRPHKYASTSMYHSLVRRLHRAGITVLWGSKCRYVKTVGAYVPVALLTKKDEIDHKYYQKRMATVASRFLGLKPKELLQWFTVKKGIDQYGEKKK